MADITRGARGRKHPRNPGAVDIVEQVPRYDSYVKTMLHFEGADGSTIFTDDIGKIWTPAGNVQIDTAQKKFGVSSGYFDGNGDYIVTASHADFVFGTGDFTIDFWVRFASLGGAQLLYDGRPNATQGTHVSIFAYANNVYFYTNGGNAIVGTTTLVINQWYHIALVRNSGVTKLYLNGTQDGSSYTDTNNYLNGTDRPVIGVDGSGGATSPFNGWLDEYRISKGIARWTSNFTPPTAEY